MGHSCGNSDRTLLNTLFEHKNCVSIKPYYYEWTDEEGGHSDNYIEIIQNISRNFNSMQLMRDRIVNKLYCRPLPQKPKVAAIE
jgi:L-lysine 2,3-aminomutase